GLDSLMAVELRQRLQRGTGLSLPATMGFDHPSPHHVAKFLQESLSSALGQTSCTTRAERTRRVMLTPNDEPIAILGIGLRVPGGVFDLAGFWSLMEQGIDTVAPVPEDRWKADEFYDPDPDANRKSYVREGAFLDRVDLFDAAFFGISPREA